jgi:glycopeptide antibiotics resistance protein
MIGLFIIYVLFVVKALFLDHRLFMLLNGYNIHRSYNYNLIPFKTIATFISRYDQYNFNTWFNNLFGNILLFIPLGFSAPYFSRKTRNLKRFVLFIVIVIFILEASQMLLHLGSFDIDDIILNSLGGLVGFSIYTACVALLKKLIPSCDVASRS